MSLTSFLKKCPSISKIVFPAEDQRFIEAEEVIRCISYEGDGYAANKVAGDFFSFATYGKSTKDMQVR